MVLQGWRNEAQPKVMKSMATLTKIRLMEPEGQCSLVELRDQGGADWLMGQVGAEGLEGTGRAREESPCHGRAGPLKLQGKSGLNGDRSKAQKGASEWQDQRNGWLWWSRQESKVRCEPCWVRRQAWCYTGPLAIKWQ